MNSGDLYLNPEADCCSPDLHSRYNLCECSQNGGMGRAKRKPRTILRLPDLEQSSPREPHIAEFAAVLRARDSGVH